MVDGADGNTGALVLLQKDFFDGRLVGRIKGTAVGEDEGSLVGSAEEALEGSNVGS